MQKRTSQTKGLSGRAQSDRGDHDRADDEHAAHRGRALFAAVQLGQLVHFRRGADRLADLERNQFPNDVVAEQKRDREGGDRREDRAKGDVVEDVEAFELLRQAMQEKHHDAQ